MGGPFGKIVHKQCCCGGICPGCCMPVDEYGNAVEIPFEVDAPGCALDGFTGVFDPLAVGGESGPCGICGSWGYALALDFTGKFWMSDGMGGCDLVPVCDITICMILTCDLTLGIADDAGNDECCRRIRLQVSTPYEFAGANQDSLPTCTGGVSIWGIAVGPDSCSCSGGFSAIFSLGMLTPIDQVDPQCGTVPPCVPDCDMTGLRILI